MVPISSNTLRIGAASQREQHHAPPAPRGGIGECER
jgi:hypothetical protein